MSASKTKSLTCALVAETFRKPCWAKNAMIEKSILRRHTFFYYKFLFLFFLIKVMQYPSAQCMFFLLILGMFES